VAAVPARSPCGDLVRHRRGELLPRLLIAFLQDGIRPERATLRVNGTAWQFRHALIQDHLTNTTRPMVLRHRADAGDWFAARELAQLLRQQRNLDEAIAVLRRAANAGNRFAAEQLAQLLRQQGNLDELRTRAAAGDWPAGQHLNRLLREQGNLDELRRRAAAGDRHADLQLAEVLWEQGHLDVLRRRAAAGDGDAAEQLAQLPHQLPHE
jgi:hypothetical protein